MISFETVAVDLAELPERTDLRALFESDGPIELEVGCGKGGFLLRQARAHPERNFVGIEWANKFYKFAADRMARWGLGNVRIIRTDARQFVMHRLAPACLSAMHIYHPDPWPKKRHHKRRLIQPEFVEAVVRVLASSARLAIQTDHAGYFEHIKAVTAARPELAPTAFEDEEFGTSGGIAGMDSGGSGCEKGFSHQGVAGFSHQRAVETNYEIKYAREGRAFYRLAYRRI